MEANGTPPQLFSQESYFYNYSHPDVQAFLEGKTSQKDIDAGGFIQALIKVIPTILTHSKFSECGENQDRSTAHLMVLFAFIGLFIVTSIAFVSLYGLGNHGPFSQMNPVKWLANIAGVALCVGSFLMIKSRLDKKEEQPSSYVDWYLVVLVARHEHGDVPADRFIRSVTVHPLRARVPTHDFTIQRLADDGVI